MSIGHVHALRAPRLTLIRHSTAMGSAISCAIMGRVGKRGAEMNYKAFFGSILLAIAGPFAGPADADCPPPHLLNSIKLESVAGGNRVLVPVTINGAPEKLILDTGAGVTQLAP